jgi:LPXTG-motif cell wall-anchored protein
MVACPDCGRENDEGAKFCVGCGAAISSQEPRFERRVVRRERRPRDECFGLPHGGAIFGLFLGAIIILWGLSEFAGWQIEIGTFAIIIIGLLIVAGGIFGLTRRRS